jgi:hypothetical protein
MNDFAGRFLTSIAIRLRIVASYHYARVYFVRDCVRSAGAYDYTPFLTDGAWLLRRFCRLNVVLAMVSLLGRTLTARQSRFLISSQ